MTEAKPSSRTEPATPDDLGHYGNWHTKQVAEWRESGDSADALDIMRDMMRTILTLEPKVLSNERTIERLREGLAETHNDRARLLEALAMIEAGHGCPTAVARNALAKEVP